MHSNWKSIEEEFEEHNSKTTTTLGRKYKNSITILIDKEIKEKKKKLANK